MTCPYVEVIGDPIAHSRSPLIHNYWIGKLGLNADYRAFHVPEGTVGDYLSQRCGDENWLGCNVTMPHKQAVIPHLAQLDPLAKKIGAVNTIVRQQDGSLFGYNTDAPGFLEVLEPELANTHLFRMARILGTGGAARAIVVALAEQGFTLVLSGRNTDKAASLLNELAPGKDHHVAPLSHFADPTDFAFDDREGCLDLVINASPLGMKGQAPLQFDLSHAPPGSIFYDIVTSPLETPFLADAKAANMRSFDGLCMLIGQAAYAFEKFFGQMPPRDDGDQQLRDILVQ